MNQSKLIALAGGIGVGKSAVAKILSKYKNLAVLDCDEISKQISASDEVKSIVAKEFGEQVLTNGILNKKKLAKVVFDDKIKLNKLNGILHPLIFDELNKQIKACKTSYIFVMIPLLIETNAVALFDEVWLVTSNLSLRISRVMDRDCLTQIEVEKRIRNQAKEEDLRKIAHIIIENNSDLEKLEKDVDNIMGDYGIEKTS